MAWSSVAVRPLAARVLEGRVAQLVPGPDLFSCESSAAPACLYLVGEADIES